MASIAEVLNKKFNVSGGNIAEALAQAVEALGKTEFISYQVTSSLPEEGEVGTIYFVSNNKGANDVYDEYIFYNGQFEKIGGGSGGSTPAPTIDLVKVTNSEIDAMF